jgi:hypothetical protein
MQGRYGGTSMRMRTAKEAGVSFYLSKGARKQLLERTKARKMLNAISTKIQETYDPRPRLRKQR